MKKKVIAKFGGSSVKDVKAFMDCVRIVKETPDLGVVVISATYNTTNELEELFSLLKKSEEGQALALWQSLKNRHLKMATGLGGGIVHHLTALLTELEGELYQLKEKKSFLYEDRDHLLSFGERISSHLFFWLLSEDREITTHVELLDATKLIKTDSTYGMAFPDEGQIFGQVSLFKDRCEGTLFITQGFLGIDNKGKRTTLGREGSDYTATLLADAFDAKEVHIWTDVDGIYTADPHLISDAKRLETLSYNEATLLAQAGAKVLFPKTLSPLKSKKIPLRVGSTREPHRGGTWIGGDQECSRSLIGLTLKERSDGLIITIIGHGVSDLDIEQSEIDRGDSFRSFYLPSKNVEEVLSLWYQRYFN